MNALQELLDRDFDLEFARLRTILRHPLIRDSQHEASEAIEKAIAERRRKLLVTMAMGIGETLTAVNEVYRLMNPASLAGPVPCRPQTLAAQTVRASRASSPSGVRNGQVHKFVLHGDGS